MSAVLEGRSFRVAEQAPGSVGDAGRTTDLLGGSGPQEFLCACGCGEQVNPVYVQAKMLRDKGMMPAAIAREMCVSRGYIKTLLRKPPRYVRGHTGRVVHRTAKYLSCRSCGTVWYAYHPEDEERRHDCAEALRWAEYRVQRTLRWEGFLNTDRGTGAIRSRRDLRAEVRRMHQMSSRKVRKARAAYRLMRREQEELERLISQQKKDANRDVRSTAWMPTSWDRSLNAPVGVGENSEGIERGELIASSMSVEDEVLDGLDAERNAYLHDLVHVVEYQRKAHELGRDPRRYVAERMGVSLNRVLKMEADIDLARRVRSCDGIEPEGEADSIELDGRWLERAS